MRPAPLHRPGQCRGWSIDAVPPRQFLQGKDRTVDHLQPDVRIEDLSTQQAENLHRHRRHIDCRLLAGDLACQSKGAQQNFGDIDAELGQQTADHVDQLRALLDQEIARTMEGQCCCSADFIATNRMVGRVTASQIASASTASFLPRFTYGFT